MRTLLLFDIDGTILWGGQAAKTAFRTAMLEVWGSTGPIDTHSFGGKTDPQILRELLTLDGFADADIDAGFSAFWRAYMDGFVVSIAEVPPRALPGAVDLVRICEGEDDVAMGLVTGNIEPAAELKLESVGLGGVFPIGAFGSDHEVRNHLPGIAMERAEQNWGKAFHADTVWVIGDTPRDVECGKAHGTRTLAVATGHFEADVLRECGADVVVESFEEVSAVAEVILG